MNQTVNRGRGLFFALVVYRTDEAVPLGFVLNVLDPFRRAGLVFSERRILS